MSWDVLIETWVPDNTDKMYAHLLLTSRQNLGHVVSWLDTITPPWMVHILCLGDDTVQKTVFMLGALEIQSWGMMLVTPEHRKEFHENETSLYDYLDSRLRVPWWQR